MEKLVALQSRNGYLPIEDHGLIGDGSTAALVGRDGGVKWLCIPRFDSQPAFAALLDSHIGGEFAIRPARLQASCQRYVDDTGVLLTEMESEAGRVRVTDALTLRYGADIAENSTASRGELLRVVEGLHGDVDVDIDIEIHGGARVTGARQDFELRGKRFPDLRLSAHSTKPLNGTHDRIILHRGQRWAVLLSWDQGSRRHRRVAPEDLLHQTIDAWRRWSRRIAYDGPRPDMVRRSAITLKLLDHFRNGAIVAAPTSSLPEALQGRRNWDYRYSWVRDAAFSVYAMRRIGLTEEAYGFLAWVLDAVEHNARPQVLYDLDGADAPHEVEDNDLCGYLESRPVRWGNAAAHQIQNDVYGEILDCAYQWAASGGTIDEVLWHRLRPLVDAAAQTWRVPDRGIWEVRSPGRAFTYSAALCHVAVDRGARLTRRLALQGDTAEWDATARRIRRAIIEQAWNDDIGAISESLGGRALDASVLALPLRRVVPADHPKMVSTCHAVMHGLDAGDGLLFRYRKDELPDGLPGDEGAFLLCSFWLVDNLAWQGKLDSAAALYESLCDRANALGLLPEQIDPSSQSFLGNFPQAISHVGVISSGYNLARLQRQ